MDGTKTPAEISAADKLEKATVSADTPDEPKATTVEAGVLERLSAAQAKAAEHYDALLRATAEAENARRRAQEDVARAHKYAIETFAEHLLPVMDSMHAALADSTADLTKVREGVELTLKQLSTAFVKGRIIELNPLGEKFDPHHHQAISMVPSDQEPNTVVAVLQRGYKIADRVLRPALVTVAQVK
ncbi:MAG: nucleotide exchange factor GrpE [Ottowia sp.]|nr:nucleotide exchange factor GrpE [Ottowia sp.]